MSPLYQVLAEDIVAMGVEAVRMAAHADSRATGSSQLQALQDAARVGGIEISIHRVATAENAAKNIGRSSAKRLVIAAPLRQSPAYYGLRRSPAPSGHLSMGGRS
jgi:hypothetical protein